MIGLPCSAANVRLSSGDLLVGYVRTGGRDEETFARLQPQLTLDERTRAARFHFAKDQLTFALGRVLVRRTLSRYGLAPPAGWQLEWNAYGKPDLRSSAGDAPFRFNISHCAGMVMAGFALARDIGVDVESMDRRGADIEIARFCFAPEEVRVIESLPEEQRRSAFFAVWTLKEAYIKARGMGLTIPLADFAMALDPPRISFSPRMMDQADCWFFWQELVAPSHVLAFAARRRPDEPLSVCVREVSLESLL